MKVNLVSATDQDTDFLWRLHREVMRAYVEELWGWHEEEQRERFFEKLNLENTQIIEMEGAPVGSIRVDRHPDHILLVNVAIVPAFQRRGIGKCLIKKLIREADDSGLPLRLQVFRINPAHELYRRMGFEISNLSDTHFHMEYLPRREQML
ncbi:MAG: N-acetyltransferase [Candidatus Abyssobacteria bacterium SURF_5]|uniref:N-acetyltransferase n=1 Tax=Abyssobacteria bacterium (strain SURF_5) TaxID=2093360 RepID=A0A3A4NZF2_ABYX5|nr:MAG: N-acetyltransferase [Candidatus Abyssubacteria bacterium SURF_5]